MIIKNRGSLKITFFIHIISVNLFKKVINFYFLQLNIRNVIFPFNEKKKLLT